MSVDTVFALIRKGDVAALQRVTKAGFDWSSSSPSPSRLPVLHAAIEGGLVHDEDRHEKQLLIIKWLLEQGANPEQKPVTGAKCWDFRNEDGFRVQVEPFGTNAISITTAIHEALCKMPFKSPKMCTFLDKVVDLLTTLWQQEREKVTVDASILERWESILSMKSSQNVVFETADGEVTAHDVVLIAASPVLKVMLKSPMQEGITKRIPVRDASESGVSLFVDMVYTGATQSRPDCNTMLVALDLAHRWQVKDAVCMLEEALCKKMTVQNFVSIANAAALKELEMLLKACKKFAAESKEVQAFLKRKHVPVAVRQLMGVRKEPEVESPKRRKCERFIF
ncbi:Tdpoz4 [Symbiodinium sp. CCMP2456]|nr:Tdpoz4 [Symbiodinium sp. CCMP2456]